MSDGMLQGKKALVTGGSRGIGREIVLNFLNQGASVYYVDLAEGDSLAEYQAITAKTGATVEFAQCNVADENEVSEVCGGILEKADGLDVVVNNAGITRDTLVFRMKAEDWHAVLNVNLTSAFYVSRVIARDMIKRRTGSIVNVASIVGIIGNAGQTNYSASKAGLIGFTKSLAREVAGRNVRVNAIAPGFINTKMTEKLNEEQQNALKSQIPMGRIGEPQEVANVVLFLASDLSSYLTGQVIHITGGLGM